MDRASDRAVRALVAAAVQFERLDGAIRPPATISAPGRPSGSAHKRIAAAEARVQSALASVLVALRDIAAPRAARPF